MIGRICSAIAAVALAACAPATGRVPPPPPGGLTMAITVDDIPVHGDLPPGDTRVENGRLIIAALRDAGVPAIGFINGGPGEEEPEAAPMLEDWAAVFPVGNHSWSHPNLNQVTNGQYQADIAANEPLLERLARGRDWHWFRYPFLAEGDDPARRAAIRAFLDGRGYRIADVTMDFADWAYNAPYARCAQLGDAAAMRAIEEDWIAAARHAVAESRAMSHALYGRDIPYVLLMHVGAVDARLLPRLLDMYREMGFAFVTLEEAQRDPHYAEAMDPGLPAAPRGLHAMIAQKRLPFPPGRESALDLDSLCR